MRRKRLAMIGVGMVGSGVLQQGIPAMAKTLEILSDSVDVTVYSFIPITKSKAPSRLRIRYAPFFLPGFLKLYWLLLFFCMDHLKRKYNCIHAQSPFPAGKLALKIKAIFRIRWITSIHAGEIADMPAQNFGDLRKLNLRKISKQVCEQSDHLVFMSRFQAKDLKSNLGIERNFHILPRGVEVNGLQEKKRPTPLQLLHVGYHHPIKNQVMLLETFKILSGKLPCELKIVGGNYGDEFKEKISQLGIDETITIVGTLAYPEMKKLYEDADFLLHTSWFEGLPMVAIEAMAHGAVVCGTDVGIMADLSGDCCMTVPTGDAVEMANVVMELVENPDKYETLRLRAHSWAKTHDINWHVGELKKLYFPENG